MFSKVNSSINRLFEELKSKGFKRWNKLEDLAVEMGNQTNQYKYLLRVKGEEEIIRRKKFLGLPL